MGLRWQSVDFEQNTITMEHTVTRCGSGVIKQDFRVIRMPLPLREYLLELRNRQRQERHTYRDAYEYNDYVCKWKDGIPLAPNYVTGAFKRFLLENDFPPYHFHTLRHSSATYLLSKGFQLKEIQGWLGHKKLESTNRYAHLQFDAIVDMANAFNDLIKK